jgi:hypothetical protein
VELWGRYFEKNNKQANFFLRHIGQQRNKYGAQKVWRLSVSPPKKDT